MLLVSTENLDHVPVHPGPDLVANFAGILLSLQHDSIHNLTFIRVESGQILRVFTGNSALKKVITQIQVNEILRLGQLAPSFSYGRRNRRILSDMFIQIREVGDKPKFTRLSFRNKQ